MNDSLKRWPEVKTWQVYDGKTCGVVKTVNNRIVSADPEFQRFVGQLLATLPRQMKVDSAGVVKPRSWKCPAGVGSTK